MGRRTLTAHSLEFNRKRHIDETCAPCDLDGSDLLDLFENWCQGLAPDDLHDADSNLWVRLRNARRAGRAILASVEVGSWGEVGAVVNSQSGSVLMDLTEDEAPTGMTRAVLFVPRPGETALFFSEYSGRGSGGARLLRAFASHWSHTSDFTMTRSAVSEGESWAEGADLREVEVRIRQASSDVADATNETRAVYSHVLRPPKHKVLRRDLLDELRAHPERAARTVCLTAVPDDFEVLVTLRNREGRQKKFVLGAGDGLPSMREELNAAGRPILSDERLLEVCYEKADDLLHRF